MKKWRFSTLIFIIIMCLFLQSTSAQNSKIAFTDASTPITVNLTQSKIPLVNEETTLHVEVNSIFDAPETNVKIILPPNVELISGELERIIDLKANKPESFEVKIKFSQPGNFKIIAQAHKTIDLENSWGDMDVLYLTIGQVSSKISTFGPIAYAERAQSTSEQPLNKSEISSQNLKIEPPQVVMPNKLPLDTNLKSAEPANTGIPNPSHPPLPPPIIIKR